MLKELINKPKIIICTTAYRLAKLLLCTIGLAGSGSLGANGIKLMVRSYRTLMPIHQDELKDIIFVAILFIEIIMGIIMILGAVAAIGFIIYEMYTTLEALFTLSYRDPIAKKTISNQLRERTYKIISTIGDAKNIAPKEKENLFLEVTICSNIISKGPRDIKVNELEKVVFILDKVCRKINLQ